MTAEGDRRIQMAIADLERLLQMAFDAGRKMAAEVVEKYTCTTYGADTTKKIIAQAEGKQKQSDENIAKKKKSSMKGKNK